MKKKKAKEDRNKKPKSYYEPTESPDGHDSSKRDPELLVLFTFDYSSKTRKEMDEIESELFNNGFQSSGIWKSRGTWNCSVSKEIRLKEYDSTDKFINQMFLNKKSICGFTSVEKITD